MAGAAQVERAGEGFVVDAGLLAEVFGLVPEEVRVRMQDGRITSRCETGVGEDAGRWRLTFYHGGRACRITVDASGAVLGRATIPAPRIGRGGGA